MKIFKHLYSSSPSCIWLTLKNSRISKIVPHLIIQSDDKISAWMIHPKLQLLNVLHSISWTECLLSTCFDCVHWDSRDLKGLFGWQSNNCHKKLFGVTAGCHIYFTLAHYIICLCSNLGKQQWIACTGQT